MSNYTKTLDLLEDLCGGLGYTFCRLDGHTPTGQRQRLVDSFNSPYSQNFLFLLSSKAGGVGLNLVGASHLVLYDIDWNPANDIQVNHLRASYLLSCVNVFWGKSFFKNGVLCKERRCFSSRGRCVHGLLSISCRFPSLSLKGHGPSLERRTEEDGAHLSSPHSRSEPTS